MNEPWDFQKDEEYFRQLWCYRSPTHFQHTQQLWDERADEWEDELQNDAVKSKSTQDRVDATARYLRARGLLGPEDDVIDIGCGPGRFVAEFAKTCRSAVGADLSGRMLEHGAAFAKSQGITNTGYVRLDFNQADLDELGWRKRFDLVFTSITPAVGGLDNLNRLMEMSRGFCFNSCFVSSQDELMSRFRKEELCLPPGDLFSSHWRWFYALFNLLLLWGYLPEARYYDDPRREVLTASRETARHLIDRSAVPEGMTAEQMTERMYRFLEKNADADGSVVRDSCCTYGWILWDVRRRL